MILAERIKGEIITVDSMQVYRGLNVGTAKPSEADQARVPHHLLDICSLEEPFDAARFVQCARQAVETILKRGHVPIFCGGTGLYFKAWLEGLGNAPPGSAELRAELESTPLDSLVAELEKGDPEAYSSMDLKNPRRVVRAVEVLRLTGKPFSKQRAVWQSDMAGKVTNGLFILSRSTEDLHARIRGRVEKMFQNGLVEETRQLLTQGLAFNRTAMQAIGYRQVVEGLAQGESLAMMKEKVTIRTRQFARRQWIWFRKHARGIQLEIPSDQTTNETAERILQDWTV